MKKLSLVIVLALVLTGTAFSQAFQKGDKLLSIGVGAASYIHLGNNGYYSNYYYGGYYSRIAGVLTFQAEFGIHKYVGLGFSVGAGGTGGYGYWDPEIVAPATILANCHFYQIIADKTGKNIHADKLDIYAGLNVGVYTKHKNNTKNESKDTKNKGIARNADTIQDKNLYRQCCWQISVAVERQ